MKLLIISIATLCLCACGQGSGHSAGTDAAIASTCQSPLITTAKNTKILFIGNSYTSVNCLPGLFKALSRSAGLAVEVGASMSDGFRFVDHEQLKATQDLINLAAWDFVILQNQSQEPSFRSEDVIASQVPHAQALVNAIHKKNPNAQIIYYVPQAHRQGDPAYCNSYSQVCSFGGMTEALINGYRQYQAATGGKLANAGGAWKAVVDDKAAPFSAGLLWQNDDSHPTILGSYLTAATIFSTIFNRTPVGLFHPAEISDVNASYLQKIAFSTANVH
jgi:hypothetical protein